MLDLVKLQCLFLNLYFLVTFVFMPNPKIDVTNEDVDDMLLTLLLTLYVEDFRIIDTFLNSSDQRIVA
jgi:hypothetical protein